MEKIKNQIIKISKELYQKDCIKLILVFSFFSLLFSAVYLTLGKLSNTGDHLFHIRFAEMFREKGLDVFRDFKWLYFSKIAQDQVYFIYYNFLFYIVLIPFTLVSPLFLGIKLYGVLFIATYFSALYYFLLKIKVRYAFFWVIFLIAISQTSSIWRLLLTRPYAFAPILLILELYLLHKRKYLAVFIFSFLYVYWHSVTFFFPLFVAFVYFLFYALYENRINWKLIISPLSGLVASLVAMSFFAPGFFYFIKDIYIGMHLDTIIGKNVGIAEGEELYALDIFYLIRYNVFLVTMLLVAFSFEVSRYIQAKRSKKDELLWNDSKKDPLRGALFFLTLFFLFATFLSGRNRDFFLFFAMAYVPLMGDYILKLIHFNSQLAKKTFFIGIAIASLYLFTDKMLSVQENIASTAQHEEMKKPAEWLKENTEKGEVIFYATWNWFPILFYYNTDNYYIVGIEPRFLYDYDPSLYWLWENISKNGYVCESQECNKIKAKKEALLENDESSEMWYNEQGNEVADVIKNRFESKYVLTSEKYTNLNSLMDNSDRFERVYGGEDEDEYGPYSIYKIN